MIAVVVRVMYVISACVAVISGLVLGGGLSTCACASAAVTNSDSKQSLIRSSICFLGPVVFFQLVGGAVAEDGPQAILIG
jgi:enoyl-CoA hydratase/carnithine racemase